MSDLAEIQQMLSAPFDSYSAGAWCQAANELAAEVERLREAIQRALNLRSSETGNLLYLHTQARHLLEAVLRETEAEWA